MKKYQIWIPIILLVVMASGIVSFWQKDLLLGSLPKIVGKPIPPKQIPMAGGGNRVCSLGEFTVLPSSFTPVDRLEIDEQGTILARFIVTTKNCDFPITYAWLRWYPVDLYREQYHVSLTNPVFYPYTRDLKLTYRYASYDKPLCIGAPLRVFDVPIKDARYHFIPMKNVTTVPPDSSQEFIIRGDLLVDRNDLALSGVTGRNEPEYRITAGIGTNTNPPVYMETDFAPRKFIFQGETVNDGQILDNCN